MPASTSIPRRTDHQETIVKSYSIVLFVQILWENNSQWSGTLITALFFSAWQDLADSSAPQGKFHVFEWMAPGLGLITNSWLWLRLCLIMGSDYDHNYIQKNMITIIVNIKRIVTTYKPNLFTKFIREPVPVGSIHFSSNEKELLHRCTRRRS